MFEVISQGKKIVVCHSSRKDQINPGSQIYLFPVCKLKSATETKTQVY